MGFFAVPLETRQKREAWTQWKLSQVPITASLTDPCNSVIETVEPLPGTFVLKLFLSNTD